METEGLVGLVGTVDGLVGIIEGLEDRTRDHHLLLPAAGRNQLRHQRVHEVEEMDQVRESAARFPHGGARGQRRQRAREGRGDTSGTGGVNIQGVPPVNISAHMERAAGRILS